MSALDRPVSRLRAQDLTLAYGETAVVDQLSLEVPTGRITSLVGPNGSGKSTLLKGLARLLQPAGGAAYLDDGPIHRMNTRHVARKVSVLAQRGEAPDGLTVRELLSYGRFPHRNFLGFANRNDEQTIERALDIAGVTHLADRPIGGLSGGQRQLAWIAMTLAQDAPILLLDEPTTFLDMAHQLEVLDLLQQLQVEHHRTIVLVLHDINLAARYSHRLVALHAGTIRYQGSPDEVMTPAMLGDVFAVEASILHDDVHNCPYCIPLRPLRD